jgi:hypothetical protein
MEISTPYLKTMALGWGHGTPKLLFARLSLLSQTFLELVQSGGNGYTPLTPVTRISEVLDQ